jgi:hypothetical protein
MFAEEIVRKSEKLQPRNVTWGNCFGWEYSDWELLGADKNPGVMFLLSGDASQMTGKMIINRGLCSLSSVR